MGCCHFPLTEVIRDRQDLLGLHLGLMSLLLTLQIFQMHLGLQKLLLQGGPLGLRLLVCLVVLYVEVDLASRLAFQGWGFNFLLGQIRPLWLVVRGSRASRGVDDGLGLGLLRGLLLSGNFDEATSR